MVIMETLIRKNYPTASADVRVSSIKDILHTEGFIVLTGTNPVEIVTHHSALESGQTLLGDCVHKLPFVHQCTKLEAIIETMNRYSTDFLPYYKNKIFTGIVSRTDIETTLFNINIKLAELIKEKTKELQKVNNDLRKEINAHQQTIFKLCESEERFKTIFDVVPAAIIIHSDTTTSILNPYAKKILECNDTKKIWSSLQQTEKDHLHWRFENILQTRKSSELYQITFLKDNGTCVKFEVVTGLIVLGNNTCFVSIALDKSDRATLEKEIENITGRLQNIIDSLSMGIWFGTGVIVVARNKSEELRMQVKSAPIKEMELKAISQQLHNNVGQYISALSLRCAELESRVRNQQSITLEDINGIHDLCITTNESLHDLTQLFFLKAGDVISDKDIIQNLCLKVGKIFCINVRFDVAIYYLPADLLARNHLIQFLQEALTNAAKYSGEKDIRLSILHCVNLIVYRISDNGRGFDTSLAGKGMGLRLMQFNADELAADFHIRSDNHGTVITLKLPLPENYN